MPKGVGVQLPPRAPIVWGCHGGLGGSNELIKGLLKGNLREHYRSSWIYSLGIDSKDCDGRHRIYFPQKEPCFFRAGFPRNFSSSLATQDKRSLYVEVSYSKDKPIDKNNILLRVKKDLEKVGILSRNDRICSEDINDIKYGYPIYDRNYSLALKR